MAPGTTVRIVTVAVLALLLAAVVAAIALARRRQPQGDAQASFLAHVAELRRRLLVIIGTLVGGTVLALTFRVGAWHGWPVPMPALYDNAAAQVFSAAAAHLVPPGVQLVVTSPMDGFMAQFYWAFGLGIALAIPVALHQMGHFFGPALRPRERRLLAIAIVPACLLFIAGAAFGFYWVLPLTFAALYEFSDALGAANLLQVADFSSFTLSFLVGFGLGFQTPLVMAVLTRVGLVPARVYWTYWRHAMVVILIVAMVLTPDPTIVSQLMLAVPLAFLYIIGAAVASRAQRAADT